MGMRATKAFRGGSRWQDEIMDCPIAVGPGERHR